MIEDMDVGADAPMPIVHEIMQRDPSTTFDGENPGPAPDQPFLARGGISIRFGQSQRARVERKRF